MPFYETVFIARQDLSDTQVKDLIAQFSKIITDITGAKSTRPSIGVCGHSPTASRKAAALITR
jgi:ribosomal protein S6